MFHALTTFVEISLSRHLDQEIVNIFLRRFLRFSAFYCANTSANGDTLFDMYSQTFNISHTLAGNKLVGHSNVVGASPVGAAPTTSSFSI